MDTELGKTVTEQLFAPNTVKACAAAHVDIRCDPLAFY
jgi:hypothetical protein